MITLIASIAGFIGSLLPEILKLLKDFRDKKHEIEILKLQINYNKHTSQEKLEEILRIQEMLEQQTLHHSYNSGIKWIDGFNATVRPMLAYSFFALYICIKLMQYKSLMHEEVISAYLDVIWSVDDQAIFASIISFYFGQRTFKRLSFLR